MSWILASPLAQKILRWCLLIIGALAVLAYARKTGESMGRKAERLQQIINNNQTVEVANEVRRGVARQSGAADRLRNSRWTLD